MSFFYPFTFCSRLVSTRVRPQCPSSSQKSSESKAPRTTSRNTILSASNSRELWASNGQDAAASLDRRASMTPRAMKQQAALTVAHSWCATRAVPHSSSLSRIELIAKMSPPGLT
eukprot:g48883.t1